jgi:hypothetical protein
MNAYPMSMRTKGANSNDGERMMVDEVYCWHDGDLGLAVPHVMQLRKPPAAHDAVGRSDLQRRNREVHCFLPCHVTDLRCRFGHHLHFIDPWKLDGHVQGKGQC